MSERRRVVDDDDLKAEIYATIRRLERLAKRLETYAEDNGANTEEGD